MARPDIKSAKWLGPPRSWTDGRKTGQPSVIIIHTTEGSEGRSSAENGAAYDKSRTDGTSTHLFVDQDSIVQEVEFQDEAHAARSRGNDVGIQIEVCGKAGQSVAQWADSASLGTINQLIRACYEIRKLYGRSRFPLVNLTPAQLRAGQHGFAEHKDASLGFPEDGGDHTDPGPNFPWSKLFAGIKALEAAEDNAGKEWDEMATQAQVQEAARDAFIALLWDGYHAAKQDDSYKEANADRQKEMRNIRDIMGGLVEYAANRADQDVNAKLDTLAGKVDQLVAALPTPQA